MTLHTAMKRKAERERIAVLFEEMAGRVGASCKRDRYEIDGPREISLFITKDGAAVNVDLNAEIKLGCFIGHWFFDDRRGRLFAPFFDDRRGRLFAPFFDGYSGRAPAAHHKATSLTEHAEDLCSTIEGMLLRMDDGTAFVAELTNA